MRPPSSNLNIYNATSLAVHLAAGPATNWTTIPKIIIVIAKLSPLLVLTPTALCIPHNKSTSSIKKAQNIANGHGAPTQLHGYV